MSTINWVIQKNLTRGDQLEQLKTALNQQKIDFEEIQVIPFSDQLPTIDSSRFNIFYGSPTLMLNAYKNPLLRKGIFFHPEAFTMQNYNAQWGSEMLNHDAQLTNLEAFCSHSHKSDSQWFVRPDADSKIFSGAVLTFGELQAWLKRLQRLEGADLTAQTPVVVAKPKNIEKEWRNFIVDGRVVNSSRYMLRGQLSKSGLDRPEEMIAFVEQQSRKYSPHPIFVMDVALSEGDYKIIECNCFNGTGFYDHDIAVILAAVNQYISALLT